MASVAVVYVGLWAGLGAADAPGCHTWIPLPLTKARAAQPLQSPRSVLPGCLHNCRLRLITSRPAPLGVKLVHCLPKQLFPLVALPPLSALMSYRLHAEADLREREADRAHGPWPASWFVPSSPWLTSTLRPFLGSSKLLSTSWLEGRGDRTRWLSWSIKSPVVSSHIHLDHSRHARTFIVAVPTNVDQSQSLSQEKVLCILWGDMAHMLYTYSVTHVPRLLTKCMELQFIFSSPTKVTIINRNQIHMNSRTSLTILYHLIRLLLKHS